MDQAGILDEVLPMLAPPIAERVGRAARMAPAGLEEIRLRVGRPIELVSADHSCWVGPDGDALVEHHGALPLEAELLERTFQIMARGSIHAWEEELRSGFLTLPGGHRVGICGRTVVADGRVESLSRVTGLNLRLARAMVGAGLPLLPRIHAAGRPVSALLLSPPGAGKTTLLRDLIRLISTGVSSLGLRGRKVSVVDERCELAGPREGRGRLDLGPRTDVMEGCPKARGIMLMIRSMSPEVIAVDEIGRPEDADAVREALHAGVCVLATAHGGGEADLLRRPDLSALVAEGAFGRLVLLSRRRGPGTVESVVDLTRGRGGERLAR